jgi:hypothetical protein
MSINKDDIVYVVTEDGDGKEEPVMFFWGINHFGWGTTSFFYKDKKLMCDSETMSRESIKTILCDFVDRAEFVNGKDEGPPPKENPLFS